MKRIIGCVAAVVVVGLCWAGSAAAASTYKLCSTGAGKAVLSPGASGNCAAGQKTMVLASASALSSLKSQVTRLKATLAGVTRSGNTLRFTHMNVQIQSGSGATAGKVNGLGNLIIGYNESPGAQTGSHNLILGELQTFTSYGGLIGGYHNTLGGGFSAVFGESNTAIGAVSAVTGGYLNTASNDLSSVSGGESNTARGLRSSVSGGYASTASGDYSSVSGGNSNTASGGDSSILGGYNQTLATNCGTIPAVSATC